MEVGLLRDVDMARDLGASHHWLLRASTSEIKEFVERERHMRAKTWEAYYDFDLSCWVMKDKPHA